MTAPTTRETADHAELAAMKPDDIIAILRTDRLPECSFDNGMTWVTDDVIVAETFARAADALETLLSEIAALRDYGRDVAKEALEYRRQRDELRKALELAAIRFDEIYEAAEVDDNAYRNEATIHGINGNADVAQSEARQALANQGADQ